jgi:hypothetical protein
MLGETEEYEPLSRAAYYHAMKKSGRKEWGLVMIYTNLSLTLGLK